MQKMFKNSQVTFLLFVLFMTESTVIAQGDVQGSPSEKETTTNSTATAESLSSKGFCSDNDCTAKSGRCQSTLNFFTSCREVDNAFCGTLCSCCVSCSGTCGADSDGTCKRRCSATEEQITGCEGRNCVCCKPLEKCGTGDAGLCKSNCNTNIEDEDVSGGCTDTGDKCCVPKRGCTAKCGFNYWFNCRSSDQCPFFLTQIGTCPTGCRCCGSIFG